MQDQKATALFYLKLSDPSLHLSYVQQIITRRSLNLPPLSTVRRQKASPFSVAKQIFKGRDKLSQVCKEKERLTQQLLTDRMRTARVLARESPALIPSNSRNVQKAPQKVSMLSQKRSVSTDPSNYVETTAGSAALSSLQLLNRKTKRKTKNLNRLNSIIAVCGEASTSNLMLKQSLQAAQDSSREDYSNFKGTLSTVEDLAEHEPRVLQELYLQRIAESQDSHLDSFLMLQAQRHSTDRSYCL